VICDAFCESLEIVLLPTRVDFASQVQENDQFHPCPLAPFPVVFVVVVTPPFLFLPLHSCTPSTVDSSFVLHLHLVFARATIRLYICFGNTYLVRCFDHPQSDRDHITSASLPRTRPRRVRDASPHLHLWPHHVAHLRARGTLLSTSTRSLGKLTRVYL